MEKGRRGVSVFAALAAVSATGCGKPVLHASSRSTSSGIREQQLPGSNVLWSEARKAVRLPESTPEEKRLLVDQALLMFREVYPFNEAKRAFYGDRVWAEPRLRALAAEAGALPAKEFHERLVKIFTSQRDKHTIYSLPKPYACYSTWLPVSLVRTKEKNGDYAIRVSMIGDPENPDFDTFTRPLAGAISLGARLVRYDGKPAFEALREFYAQSIGTSVDPGEAGAVDLLFQRRSTLIPLPDADSVQVEFENPDGTFVSMSLPWVTWRSKSCFDSYLASKDNDVPLASEPGVASVEGRQRTLLPADGSSSPYGDSSSEGGAKNFTRGELVDTAEPSLKYGRVKADSGKTFGYVRLSSFQPEKLSNDEMVREFIAVLEGLSDTEGLVLDLRGNGGGWLNLAEKMAQLFVPEPADLGLWQLRNSDPVRALIARGVGLFGTEKWKSALESTPRSNPFLTAGPFSSTEEANSRGQSWFKPLTVLVNANCYSSCDAFSSYLQDNRAGLIWGVDSWQSGGGGASVLEDTSTLVGDGLPFVALPHGQNFRFSVMRSIRGGRNKGFLIEDKGVRADRVVHTTLRDILDQDAEIRKVIVSDLEARAIRERRPVIRSELPAAEVFQIAAGRAFETRIETMGARSLSYSLNGRKLGDVALHPDNDDRASVRLQLPPIGLEYATLEIEGRTESHAPAFRIVRSLRGVPESFRLDPGGVLKGTASEGTIQRGLVIYHESPAKMRWVVKDGVLVSNLTPEYTANIATSGSLFAALPRASGAFFAFEAELSSEEGYDFLQLEVREGTKTSVVPLSGEQASDAKPVEKLSGEIPRSRWVGDLSAYAGREIEVRLVFLSDELEFGKGARIYSWELNAGK